MIIHKDIIQGSPQWRMLRCGIPTASQGHRCITPKTRKRSAQIDQYARELAAERLLGWPLEMIPTAAMTDGTEREAQAVASYELTHGVDTEPVGFMTNDKGTIGASPDRIFEGGLLETKNPKAGTHIGYLLGDGPDSDYFCQLQFQLYVSEYPFVDIISCFPGLPDIVVRVRRDEEFIAELAGHLAYLCDTVDALMVRLDHMGYRPAPPEIEKEEPEGDFDLTESEVSAIFAATRTAEEGARP